MLDDHGPQDAVAPYSRDYMADWMLTTFPVQASQDPMGLPPMPPADGDSPGTGNIFSSSRIELPDTVADDSVENSQPTPSRSLGAPTRYAPPMTGTEFIPKQIASQNEILFQMCKSRPPLSHYFAS